MEKLLTKEAIAIRKLREIRGLKRKEASVLLEVSHKTIEGFENGRRPLSQAKLVKYILLYGFKKADYELCLKGKAEQVKSKYQGQRPKVIEQNILRRSYQRIITKEAETLKVLRRLAGLTQYNASAFCGYVRVTIGHIENGRIELNNERIKHIVEAYGFTIKDFEYHMKSETFITDIQDNCIEIIKSLSEDKLNVVYPLLKTFK